MSSHAGLTSFETVVVAIEANGSCWFNSRAHRFYANQHPEPPVSRTEPAQRLTKYN